MTARSTLSDARGPDRWDVVVVGAGAWGLATAWTLGRAGARVALVDDGGPAATDVSAGMLAPWSELADEAERVIGPELRAAADAWAVLARTLEDASGQQIGYRRTGSLYVAARPEHRGVVDHLRRRVASRPPLLAADALLAIEPELGPPVRSGIALDDEGAVEPQRVRAALRIVCAASGVATIDGSVIALARARGRTTGVDLADGRTLAAGRVILATGATARLTGSAIRPVRGEILELAPRGGQRAAITRLIRLPELYLVPRDDGRITVGATVEESGELEPTAEGVHRLLDDALRVVPALGRMVVARVSCGLRPATADGMPILGPAGSDDGLGFALGGYRHGILLLPAVIAAATGTIPAPFRHERPGVAA